MVRAAGAAAGRRAAGREPPVLDGEFEEIEPGRGAAAARRLGPATDDPGAARRIGVEPALLADPDRSRHPRSGADRRPAARQAEQLAGQLAAAGIGRLIASPYRRALETATIVASALDLAIAVEPLVRERCVFSCDLGTPREPAERALAGRSISAISRSSGGASPDETEASLAERCVALSRQDRPISPTVTQVAVITHWGFIRALTGQEVTNATLVRLD